MDSRVQRPPPHVLVTVLQRHVFTADTHRCGVVFSSHIPALISRSAVSLPFPFSDVHRSRKWIKTLFPVCDGLSSHITLSLPSPALTTHTWKREVDRERDLSIWRRWRRGVSLLDCSLRRNVSGCEDFIYRKGCRWGHFTVSLQTKQNKKKITKVYKLINKCSGTQE